MSCDLGIDSSLGSNWKISLVVPFDGNKFVCEVVVACNLSIIPCMSHYIFWQVTTKQVALAYKSSDWCIQNTESYDHPGNF